MTAGEWTEPSNALRNRHFLPITVKTPVVGFSMDEGGAGEERDEVEDINALTNKGELTRHEVGCLLIVYM